MNDYERIAKTIRYLDAERQRQPTLAELAEHVGLSPFHFHRLFSRWAGVTPKDFLQCLTVEHAKELLRRGASVLETSLEVGLSGPGRLHDLCVGIEAASPGEIKSGGAEWTLVSGFAETPVGTCLLAESPRGICHLSFVDRRDRRHATGRLGADWPRARIAWDDDAATERMAAVFVPRGAAEAAVSLKTIVRGTAFQVRVWRALLQVPAGSLVSYRQLAASIGRPRASRAVGTALSHNPVALLIPCHRVIRETGALAGYRWGTERKKALIAWEHASALNHQAANV